MKIPKVSPTKTIGFFKAVRGIFVIIAILSIVFSAVSLWNEYHEIEPILKEVGGKIFNPLYTLDQHLLRVKESGMGFYPEDGNFIQNFFGFWRNIYLIFEPLLIVYLMFYYIYLFSLHVLVGDNSRKMQGIITGFVIFVGIQFLYIAVFTDLPLKTPFSSIGNIIRALQEFF